MNITKLEMDREVEALKSHRRISVNRPILDPDLPNMAAILGGGQDIIGRNGDIAGETNDLNRQGTKLSSNSSSSPIASSAHGTPARSDSNRSGRLSYVGGVDLRDDGYPVRDPSSSDQNNAGSQRLSSRDSLKTLDGAREALGKGSSNSGRSKFTARRRGTNDPSGRGEGISISQDRGERKSMLASGSGDGRSSPSNDGQDSSVHGGTVSGPADPSHLFWVPASIHPEISPSDFRKFLQEHASRAVRDHEVSSPSSSSPSTSSPPSPSSSSSSSNFSTSPSSASSNSPIDSNAIHNPMLRGNNQQKDNNSNETLSPTSQLLSRSTSLARRGSTLRRQYTPDSEDDTASDSASTSRSQATPQPGRSSSQILDPDDIPLGSPLGPGAGVGGSPIRSKSMRTKLGDTSDKAPTLSLDDLQKLERLAEEASLSQDPSRLRHALRRTMSVNAGSGECPASNQDRLPRTATLEALNLRGFVRLMRTEGASGS